MKSPDQYHEEGPDKAAQIRAFTSGVQDAMIGLGREMERSDVARGVHYSEHFREPRTDSFGSFNTKWKYTEGCTADAELDKGVGELVVGIRKPDGSRRVVSVGPTPAEWNPQAGGKHIESAGEPGEYLMAIQDPDATGGETTAFCYLDREDLAVEYEHGQEFAGGEIQQVVGLLNT